MTETDDTVQSLRAFLAAFATDNTTTVDLTGTGAGAYLIARAGERTAVVNVVNAGDHLSVDVRGYVGDRSHDSRMIGFGPGWASHVPGQYPLCVVVVGEAERPNIAPPRRGPWNGDERRSGTDRRQQG